MKLKIDDLIDADQADALSRALGGASPASSGSTLLGVVSGICAELTQTLGMFQGSEGDVLWTAEHAALQRLTEHLRRIGPSPGLAEPELNSRIRDLMAILEKPGSPMFATSIHAWLDRWPHS